MMQQINLYQPMFRRQKKLFSAVTILQIWAFFLVVLGVIYSYGASQLTPLETELIKLERDIVTLQVQMTDFKKRYPKQLKSKLLENEIARLEKELQERQIIQKMLAGRKFGNTEGFSGYLEAMARQHIDGTWLTKIVITNGGTALALEGKTTESELLPQYIQKLSAEGVLDGLAFNVMELKRPDASGQDTRSPELLFRISTH